MIESELPSQTAYYQDRIKCPKQRMKAGLSTVEITISSPPWIRSYLSDFLFCPGNTYHTLMNRCSMTQYISINAQK